MRCLGENSTNLRFHVVANSASRKRSACLRGMGSAVQHLGGMCCGSSMDSWKRRRRHSPHCRWPHLSLGALRRATSSMQIRHVTLGRRGAGAHVSMGSGRPFLSPLLRAAAKGGGVLCSPFCSLLRGCLGGRWLRGCRADCPSAHESAMGVHDRRSRGRTDSRPPPMPHGLLRQHRGPG